VNDAPALRAAHVGVAMGGRGSDVAREAAGLALLKDDFGSLVAAVRLGRRIFANLRQALLYVLAVHVPLIGMSLPPLLLGAPPMLLPLHAMFLEFVIDPACSLAFEAERQTTDPMAVPPRDATEHVLGLRHIAGALAQGGIAFAAAAGAYASALMQGASENATRAATVTAIVLMNLVLLLNDRSNERHWLARMRSPNPMLWTLVSATLIAWGAVLAFEPLRALFRLQVVWSDLALHALPGVALAAVALELIGRWWPWNVRALGETESTRRAQSQGI
jgi:Ca2+-transporting ATPase